MWSSDDFDTLNAAAPFPLSVDWDLRPSPSKYGHVNSLLAVFRFMGDLGAKFSDTNGTTISHLAVAPVKRKLTDRRKRIFSIVGHQTSSPICVAVLDRLQVDIYFNQHILVETETTFRQYFPSASVILRPRNFLKTEPVPSPGSWGPDIIWMSYDWAGTFVFEAAFSNLTGSARRNFRGFKLIPTIEKHFLTAIPPTARDRSLLQNNGFTSLIIGADLGTCWPAISKQLSRYYRKQIARLGREVGHA